jgi:hypothetical protein
MAFFERRFVRRILPHGAKRAFESRVCSLGKMVRNNKKAAAELPHSKYGE